MVRRLKSLDLNTNYWILEADLGRKGIRYRVLVGAFKSASEASRLVKPLKRLKLNPLVRKWTRWVK